MMKHFIFLANEKAGSLSKETEHHRCARLLLESNIDPNISDSNGG